MSGAIAGAALGEGGIPHAFRDHLENGHRGRDHVIGLADAIYRRWVARNAGGEPPPSTF